MLGTKRGGIPSCGGSPYVTLYPSHRAAQRIVSFQSELNQHQELKTCERGSQEKALRSVSLH